MTWLCNLGYIATIHKSIQATPHIYKVMNPTYHKTSPLSGLLIGQHYEFTSKDLQAYENKGSDFPEYQQLTSEDLQ